MKNLDKESKDMVNSLAKQIAKALNYVSVNCDRTFISVVKTKNNDGTYSVFDDFGTLRNVVLALPNVTLEEGQRVFVTIPCGNISQMYISGIHPQVSKR